MTVAMQHTPDWHCLSAVQETLVSRISFYFTCNERRMAVRKRVASKSPHRPNTETCLAERACDIADIEKALTVHLIEPSIVLPDLPESDYSSGQNGSLVVFILFNQNYPILSLGESFGLVF